jgi:hypothetical protein
LPFFPRTGGVEAGPWPLRSAINTSSNALTFGDCTPLRQIITVGAWVVRRLRAVRRPHHAKAHFLASRLRAILDSLRGLAAPRWQAAGLRRLRREAVSQLQALDPGRPACRPRGVTP